MLGHCLVVKEHIFWHIGVPSSKNATSPTDAESGTALEEIVLRNRSELTFSLVFVSTSCELNISVNCVIGTMVDVKVMFPPVLL